MPTDREMFIVCMHKVLMECAVLEETQLVEKGSQTVIE